MKTLEEAELDAVVEEVESNVIDIELEETIMPEESDVFSVSDDLAAIVSNDTKKNTPKEKNISKEKNTPKEKKTKPLKVEIVDSDSLTDEDGTVEIELTDFGNKPKSRKKWKYSKFKSADDPEEVGEIVEDQKLPPEDLV